MKWNEWKQILIWLNEIDGIKLKDYYNSNYSENIFSI